MGTNSLLTLIAKLSSLLQERTNVHPAFNESLFDELCKTIRMIHVFDPECAEVLGHEVDAWVERNYDWGYAFEHNGANAGEDRALYGRAEDSTYQEECERFARCRTAFLDACIHYNADHAWMWSCYINQEFPDDYQYGCFYEAYIHFFPEREHKYHYRNEEKRNERIEAYIGSELWTKVWHRYWEAVVRCADEQDDIALHFLRKPTVLTVGLPPLTTKVGAPTIITTLP